MPSSGRTRPRRPTARSRAPANRASMPPATRTAPHGRASPPSASHRPGTAIATAVPGRACGACTSDPCPRPRRARDARRPRVPLGAHVVPGRHHVDPQLVGAPQERPELDLAVAARARVRRAPCLVLGHEVLDHGRSELVRQVHDLERDPGDPRHLGGVRPGDRPAAPVLHAVQVHEVHVRTHDVVSLLLEQTRGDRRIDPARHRDQHGRHARRLPRGPPISPAGILGPA